MKKRTRERTRENEKGREECVIWVAGRREKTRGERTSVQSTFEARTRQKVFLPVAEVSERREETRDARQPTNTSSQPLELFKSSSTRFLFVNEG